MDNKSIFNLAICIIGIAILSIHTINILLKRNRRKDENALLVFVAFTILHFVAYLTFTLVKSTYTSNELILTSYTIFYVMNNVEAFLFFAYAIIYVKGKLKITNIVSIINLVMFFSFIVLDIANIFTRIFFYAEDGIYMRSKLMIISQGYQFVALISVFILTVFDKKLHIVEKIAFMLYCSLPLVAIVIQNALPGYAIAYLSIIISIEILFLFVNVRKNTLLEVEAKRNKEAEIKIMMSQIQPHFIYNTLASISTLIKIDQNKAQKALDDFTEYLRANLSSLTETHLILFSDELKHIKTYVSLEKMRFNNRLNVVYELDAHDFFVPPLSIQPIVENAIKHGILKNIKGGTVTIRTYEEEDAYYVEVIDDGVGFDINNFDLSNNKHVGINNVKSRLSSMSDAEMSIDSEPGKGTRVVVKFNKQL